MSVMYFIKVNINSEIYKVYENENLRIEILNGLLSGVNEKIRVETIYNDKKAYAKFINLINEENIISGRTVLIYENTEISYNDNIDDVEEYERKNAAQYITFVYDVFNERIAFTYKRDFGYRMFINIIKKLLEKCSRIEDVKFELFLDKDLKLLEEKIKKFNSISSICLKVIPPNNDKEDFEELFGDSSEEIKETEATRFSINLSSRKKQGINIRSKYLRKFIESVSKGYGELKIKGKGNEKSYTITSEQDAPYKKPISDKNKDSVEYIREEGTNSIREIVREINLDG